MLTPVGSVALLRSDPPVRLLAAAPTAIPPGAGGATRALAREVAVADPLRDALELGMRLGIRDGASLPPARDEELDDAPPRADVPSEPELDPEELDPDDPEPDDPDEPDEPELVGRGMA